MSDFGCQKPQIWANFDIWSLGDSSTDLLLRMRTKFDVLDQTHGLRLHAKFHLDRFILSPSGGDKTPNLAILLTAAFCGVASCRRLRKLTQVHKCVMEASKLFLYSNAFVSDIAIFVLKRDVKLQLTNYNAFVAKWCSQTLTFKSVTDKQTYRQKTQRFSPPRRRVKSEPHQTWHGDREPRARSCTSKTFEV